jgi:hypothetical protein
MGEQQSKGRNVLFKAAETASLALPIGAYNGRSYYNRCHVRGGMTRFASDWLPSPGPFTLTVYHPQLESS